MQHGERSANSMLYFEVDLEKGKKVKSNSMKNRALEVELGVEPRVNLTQQRNRKRYKGKPRAHLSLHLGLLCILAIGLLSTQF
jgi:hypothetical protein